MSKLATRRALLLLNPKARRGQELIAPIVGRLERGRLSVTVETFEALPEIASDIVRLRQMADLVVVCGGDGSVSAAAMAVVESRLSVAACTSASCPGARSRQIRPRRYLARGDPMSRAMVLRLPKRI